MNQAALWLFLVAAIPSGGPTFHGCRHKCFFLEFFLWGGWVFGCCYGLQLFYHKETDSVNLDNVGKVLRQAVQASQRLREKVKAFKAASQGR